MNNPILQTCNIKQTRPTIGLISARCDYQGFICLDLNYADRFKVLPQFYIAHFYCAHLITYNFIHYTYRLKKNHFVTILCYFKTSLVTFVQIITLKSMFSKKAYKSVATVSCVCSIFIYLYFTF